MNNITISMVAERAGCSRTTVSRYLNGKYEYMSEATRAHIEAVIEEVGYKPNRMARGLRLQESKQIGVLVSNIRSPFSAILYAGILEECEKNGYSALLASSEDNPQKERDYIHSMMEQAVDGMIINSTGENVELIRGINAKRIPIVLADRPLAGTNCDLVTSDAIQGVDIMLDYLFEQGYSDIAMVSGKVGTNGTRQRRSGEFKRYMKEKGQKKIWFIEYPNHDDTILETEIMNFLENAEGKKHALFGINGVVVREIAKLLRKKSVAYPEQVGLCGFDNYEWMELIGPGMTVIEHQIYNMGVNSARCIMERLQEKGRQEAQTIELACKLIIRGSV